ncbi:glycosyltransferase family 4 protein [Pseudoalteromonas sp. S1688]|uniref:glycosyltransferase family 4 protein n=1 Tax=Pseudoalteromonas sp. S1688 TaxID=579511 RepID=UPI00110B222C|nr:glycosyltransferase family 4 protein [Pseudoalteromonas sp. S1688]TMP47583.1 glycosyltransferase family 1 protein [Pseudoalteromonas sp. S1688]
MKIKVVHVQVVPILSGVQSISLEIFKGLDSEKYEKFIICSGAYDVQPEFTELFRCADVEIIQINELKREINIQDCSAFWSLFKLFKKHRFDICHTHSTKPGVLARVAAKLAGIKVIIHTIHGVSFHKNEPTLKRFFFYIVEFFSTFFGNTVTCVNNYYRKYYRYISSKKFLTIYNGVRIPVEVNKTTNKTDSKLKILFLSRLERAKDPLTLLKAINLLVNEYKIDNIELIIAGDGELRSELEQYAKRNNIFKYITFAGWVTEKDRFYLEADIFCVPSIFEAFGLVFAEAGSFELPTVATYVEGIPEVVIDNETGYLVAPGDFEALALKLKYLIKQPEARYHLGKKARQHISKNFTVSKMVDKYIDLYEKELKRC